MNILHVCANPKPVEESVSKQLAARFFGKMNELNPEAVVTEIDLYEEKPPFLSEDLYHAMWNPIADEAYEPTKAEEASVHYAEKQAELLKSNEVLVLTMPMWNFSAPAAMKAWIDQAIAPGFTFDLSSEGVTPLHTIKTLVLLVASGGVYKEGDARDGLSAQIEAAFEFIGVDDIRIAWADGQNALFCSDCEARRDMAFDAAEELAEDLAEEDTAE